MRCIWCKKENSDSAVEHIIPEALGCPDYFILANGLVCRRCNNGLAHLDQAVIGDFDISLFMANVPGKKGKPPAIHSRGNLVGRRGATGPEMSINMERFPVVSESGSKIGAYGRSSRNIKATLTHDGPNAEIKFSTSIGQNPKFVRGIFKIGFSSLVYFLGGEFAQSPMFDPIREFVRNGTGTRHVLVMESDDTTFRNQAWPPYQNSSGYLASVFRLAAMEFLADLSPDHSLFPTLKESAMQSRGTSGWTWLPVGR